MKHIFAIGIAGAAGALLRTMIGHVIRSESGFPFATWTVNMIATFLLCFIVAGVLQKFPIDQDIEEAITVGFLGSFSTFSALSIETVLLIENGLLAMAVLYVVASFVGGIGAGMLGFAMGRKWTAHDNT